MIALAGKGGNRAIGSGDLAIGGHRHVDQDKGNQILLQLSSICISMSRMLQGPVETCQVQSSPRCLAAMNISEPCIRRPVGTSLLAVGLLMAGVTAYRMMPVAAIPRVDFPVISVSASLPGADPATIASSVAAPLERRLGQISGVTEMTSQSTLGGTSITLQFDLNRNVDRAARDVQAAINAAANDLPINLPSPPTYRKINPADAPIMILAMISETLKPAQVYE